MPTITRLFALTGLSLFASHSMCQSASPAKTSPKAKQVILFVWDGLRPDSITLKDTPNLYKIKHTGSYFNDNHASFPTLTMVNASSFTTGDLAGKTGFYGNVIWVPRAKGDNAEGHYVNFKQPVFTEDYEILKALNTKQSGGPLLQVGQLFSQLHKKGIRTAAVGKSGPVALQTNLSANSRDGVILDEKHVYPLAFAKWLIKKHYKLPVDAPIAFNPGTLVLNKKNGNPTKFLRPMSLTTLDSKALGAPYYFRYPNNVTTDPKAATISPYTKANSYLMSMYLTAVKEYQHPQLSVIWLRNPDSTEHNYGVGTRAYHHALQAQDHLLGNLIHKLKQQKQWRSTDLIVASDHSHSNVSGDLHDFPLRGIHSGLVTTPTINGYSVSGDFRPADLMRRAGFNAYDGDGCEYDPTLLGIKANGQPVYKVKTDKSGKACHNSVTLSDLYGHRSEKLSQSLYTTGDFRLPKKLPHDAIVIAANGGSTYFYVPSHNEKLIQRVVRFLQSREQFGAIFVRGGNNPVPGTLPLRLIKLYNPKGKNPDIIVSSHTDSEAMIQGMKGTEYNSSGINRGMHGSFGPIDIHNTLIAIGPDFRQHFTDPLPSANNDVPVTIAYLFGLPTSGHDGRVLHEALTPHVSLSRFQLSYDHIIPKQPARQLVMRKPTDPNGKDIDSNKHTFTEQLNIKRLRLNKKTTLYFDQATEKRY